MFTSGSAGLPKAVPINEKNLISYIDRANHSIPGWEKHFVRLIPEDWCKRTCFRKGSLRKENHCRAPPP